MINTTRYFLKMQQIAPSPRCYNFGMLLKPELLAMLIINYNPFRVIIIY